MPPLSGFIGKIWILKTTLGSERALVFWPVYLIASFALLVALSRAGTSLFWERKHQDRDHLEVDNAKPLQVIAVIGLLACSPLMVIFAGPITEYMIAAATQLHDISSGINTVLKGGL